MPTGDRYGRGLLHYVHAPTSAYSRRLCLSHPFENGGHDFWIILCVCVYHSLSLSLLFCSLIVFGVERDFTDKSEIYDMLIIIIVY